MKIHHLIIPFLPSNYSTVSTAEGTKTDSMQALPIKLQHNNYNDNDEDVNDDDDDNNDGDDDDDDDDDDDNNRFVSALGVLSSFRKYTSLCLVFSSVFKNS